MDTGHDIVIKRARVHNLKSVSLTLAPFQLIVFSGVSGSGKSSLAFDTIYAEGQRRYVESLSNYAKRYLGSLPKPDADLIEGLSPTISIEQKTIGKNPRSTVGTITGIYDYLRVLYARIGIPHCPESDERLSPQSAQAIKDALLSLPEGSKRILLAPYVKEKRGELKDECDELRKKGYLRIRLDGSLVDLSEEIKVDETKTHSIDIVIDRLVIKRENAARVGEAILQTLEMGKGLAIALDPESNEETLFSQHAYSQKSGKSYPPLEPHDFSFNHPLGMCPECEGLGITQEFDVDKVIDPEKSIAEGCCSVGGQYGTVKYSNIYANLAEQYDFSLKTKWKDLSKKAQNVFLHGVNKRYLKMIFVHPETKKSWMEYVRWKGVLHEAKVRFMEATSDGYKEKMRLLMHEAVCSSCCGSRIRPYPAATKFGGKTLAELCALSIEEAYDFFSKQTLSKNETIIGGELCKEILSRLSFLINVGLTYITIDRGSPTLSGGEAQRVRLASQIGSGLVGTTYILDEPSIGLHPRDNTKLIDTLIALKERGNTVIVVEHDEETLRAADYIVDVGPEAGYLGGEIVAEGSYETIISCPRSITGQYLSGKKTIPFPAVRRKIQKENSLEIVGARHNNLKDVSVTIPLGVLTAITGVSGSGKSSLVSDILFPALSNKVNKSSLKVGAHTSLNGWDALDKVIEIDQSPIGRTPRSNPSTYVKLLDDIRDLFAEIPEAKAQGFKPGRFSFNVQEGSCLQCKGMGYLTINMDFLDDEYVTCPTCQGKRFDPLTLSILYKGKSIHDVLEMTIEAAASFFHAHPHISHKLTVLKEVGLGYIALGQSSTTLSGGEAQRIKLAKELIRPATGKTLYILDEPTTGLHFHDISKLILLLQNLIDEGNSVVVIEHNIDLIKCADWVIDLGPEGGRGGGEVIAEGTPEEIAASNTPTGIALSTTVDHGAKTARTKNKKLEEIRIVDGAQNTLQNVSTTIPRGKITVCTGPSGSGKSSLAFDTVYAEGQRRYTDSLSPYARQFIKQMPKPKLGEITGLSPAIAIEQKHHAGNPRSTVGTITETYDYLRLLYAHMGIAHCPETGEAIRSITKEAVAEKLLELPVGTKLYILAPIDGELDEVKERLQKQGFLRIRLNGFYHELDEEIPYDPKKKNELFLVIDRLIVKEGIRDRILEAIDAAQKASSAPFTVSADGKDTLYNLAFAAASTGKTYPPITPHTFSFNADEGMCHVCNGLGFEYGADLLGSEEVMKLSPIALLDMFWKEKGTSPAFDLFEEILEKEGIDPDLPLCKQPVKHLTFILSGKATLQHKGLRITWPGLNKTIADFGKAGVHDGKQLLSSLLTKITCVSCSGKRLNPLALGVTIEEKSIADLCAMPLADAFTFINELSVQELLSETKEVLLKKLSFLVEIGLEYISLDRTAPTLSGGEAQRIHLARQLGSKLTGCLYVLDEPTIGLHPHNNERLNASLRKLAELDNTLLLVEHDPMTIAIADKIIDFGPGAGKSGGTIVAEGTLEEIQSHPHSRTGKYLRGDLQTQLRTERRKGKGSLTVRNASIHNLKIDTLTIPQSALTVVTGVSGSGKSTLITELLLPAVQRGLIMRPRQDTIKHLGAEFSGIAAFDKVIALDQNPIGHTSRADVNTYSDIHTPLRTIFHEIPEAKIRGLKPYNFSYNHLKGMCRSCWGLGYKKVKLQFMPPVRVECETCKGARLNPVSNEVTYKGKNIGAILQLTVDEAKEFLPPHPKLLALLETLRLVGLGYLTLGQEIASLSGGEAQRLRLSKELAKRSSGKTLYVFDEPTIGLHPDDTIKLIEIFQTLVDKGNTVIIIEHNLDILVNADHIIDLGPGAGQFGGEIVATGTPEALAKCTTSKTAPYLAEALNRIAAFSGV